MKAVHLAHKDVRGLLPGCCNWSLLFDKFAAKRNKNADRFAAAGKLDRGDSNELPNKQEFLREVADNYNKTGKQGIAQAITRRAALFQALSSRYRDRFRMLYFRSTSPLIVRMARASILENTGMSFEPVTGLPMVAGTGLKGAVSTRAIWEANGDAVFELTTDREGNEIADINTNRAELDASSEAQLVEIFGDNSGDGDAARAGKVIFYGLFPLDEPKLGIDILTPHPHEEDARGPIPNPFLAIEPGTVWMCPLRLLRDADGALLEKAAILVEGALATTGLGAKTAAGYGRFEAISEPTKTVQKRLATYREAQASAEEKAAENRRALAEQQKMAELEASEDGMARYAAMSDQEFAAFVNQFRHEEGLAGKKWPGTLQEQYDLFRYCAGEGNGRCSGRKQKKALRNLRAKFGGGNHD